MKTCSFKSQRTQGDRGTQSVLHTPRQIDGSLFNQTITTHFIKHYSKKLKPRIYHSFPHPVKFDGTVVQYGTVVYSGIQWYTVVQYPGPTEPAFGKALACFPPLAFQVSINGCQSGSSRAKSSDWGLKASAIDRNDDRRHMKRYIMDFKDSWWSPDFLGQSLTWANIFWRKV